MIPLWKWKCITLRSLCFQMDGNLLILMWFICVSRVLISTALSQGAKLFLLEKSQLHRNVFLINCPQKKHLLLMVMKTIQMRKECFMLLNEDVRWSEKLVLGIPAVICCFWCISSVLDEKLREDLTHLEITLKNNIHLNSFHKNWTRNSQKCLFWVNKIRGN